MQHAASRVQHNSNVDGDTGDSRWGKDDVAHAALNGA
jgi:hypothetical protein